MQDIANGEPQANSNPANSPFGHTIDIGTCLKKRQTSYSY